VYLLLSRKIGGTDFEKAKKTYFDPKPSSTAVNTGQNTYLSAQAQNERTDKLFDTILPIYRNDEERTIIKYTNPNNAELMLIDEVLVHSNKYGKLIDQAAETIEGITENDKKLVHNALLRPIVGPERELPPDDPPLGPRLMHDAATNPPPIVETTDTDDLEATTKFIFDINSDKQEFTIQDFDRTKLKRMMRDKLNKNKASIRLTYYLKCKYAFSLRTPNLITSMRTDARVWMITQEYKMETPEEYEMLTTAVLAAYFIDPNEYLFFLLLSNRNFYNSVFDFNSAMNGKASMYNHSKLNTLFTSNRPVRGVKQSLLFGDRTQVDYNKFAKASA